MTSSFWTWAFRDSISRFVLGRLISLRTTFDKTSAYEGQSGSKDRGDPQVCLTRYVLLISNDKPQTSNIFVANLPPHVTEQSLGIFFARCGPVGSVRLSVEPSSALWSFF